MKHRVIKNNSLFYVIFLYFCIWRIKNWCR